MSWFLTDDGGAGAGAGDAPGGEINVRFDDRLRGCDFGLIADGGVERYRGGEGKKKIKDLGLLMGHIGAGERKTCLYSLSLLIPLVL